MKIENLTADCPKRFGICTFFQESCDVPPRQIHHTHRPNRGPCSRRSKARLGRGPLGRARGRRAVWLVRSVFLMGNVTAAAMEKREGMAVRVKWWEARVNPPFDLEAPPTRG